MSTHKASASFEFFPPNTPEGLAKLRDARVKLSAARPEFFSVTYGAGGSTQDGTLQQVQAILADGHDAAPHFSCIGASRDSVRAQLAQFKAAGIRPRYGHAGTCSRFVQSGRKGLLKLVAG
jgi:methylenetetrahydrofolate reductase (NADPH)